MADKLLYVLAGYDDDTEERLSGMQNKLYELGFFGVQTKNIPMHFTLGSFETEREEEMKERLIRLSKSVREFAVDLSKIGLFQNPSEPVLFVKLEESREILELREHFKDNVDVFPWAAHTTLLIDKPEVIREAQKHVMEEFCPFSGKVTTLHLYEFFPARHILSVRLTTEEPEWLYSEEAFTIYADCMYKPELGKYRELMKQYMDSPAVMILVNQTDSDVSAIMVSEFTDDDTKILGIAVAEKYRGYGIGRKMTEDLHQMSAGRPLLAETDGDALGFYRSCGFSVEKIRKRYPDGIAERYLCRLL
ncbi:MAG: GNAT family N-acetyltransferase [Lachnospiraceae bacterium]|nr:GNAT family N-acetyltransferase [Lachnospiraceae bacterium]